MKHQQQSHIVHQQQEVSVHSEREWKSSSCRCRKHFGMQQKGSFCWQQHMGSKLRQQQEEFLQAAAEGFFFGRQQHKGSFCRQQHKVNHLRQQHGGNIAGNSIRAVPAGSSTWQAI
jgi:hypothetical protein